MNIFPNNLPRFEEYRLQLRRKINLPMLDFHQQRMDHHYCKVCLKFQDFVNVLVILRFEIS